VDDEGTWPHSRHLGLNSSETRMKLIRGLPEIENAKIKTYSAKKQADFHFKKENKELFLCQNSLPILSAKELKIKGLHQYANALAALSIGSLINLPINSMCEALKQFEGLPHRCQFVREVNGVLWFNDSKATTVASTIASVSSVANEIAGKIVLLAGGLGKQQDFSPLKEISKHLKAAILFGEDKLLFQDVFEGEADSFIVSDLEEAVKKASNIASSGDAVLLAPACASFDMFKNFEHRGDCFVQIVGNLK